MIQSSYVFEPAVAVEGMIADSGVRDVLSRLLESATADAGHFVVKGTATDQAKLPGVATDVTNLLLGVLVFQPMQEATGTANRFVATDAVAVMRRGRIWVKVAGTAIADGAVPFVFHSGADAGKVSGAAGAGPDATIVPEGSVRCLKGAAPGGLALLDLNLP
jgi:hypothetical protein